MTRDELVAALSRLTADLSLGPGAPYDDLRLLRIGLAGSVLFGRDTAELRPGLPVGTLPPLSTEERTPIEQVAAAFVDNSGTLLHHISAFARLRSAPMPAPLAAPSWAIGTRPMRVCGPFTGPASELLWADIFELFPLVAIRRNGALLAMIPTRNVTSGANRLALDGGSIWLKAETFVPGAPPDAFVGLLIQGGELGFDAPLTLVGKEIHISSTTACSLTVGLANDASPSPTNPTFDVDLPQQLKIVLEPHHAAVHGIDTFSATLFGHKLTLKRTQAPPELDADGQLLLFPCESSLDELDIKHPSTHLCGILGSARIERADWALPVTRTFETQLATARGASASIRLGRGLVLRWSGMAGECRSTSTRLDATNALLTVDATSAGFRHSPLLWRTRRPSTLSLQAKPSARAKYFLDANAEAVVAETAMSAQLDRPLMTDAKPPELNADDGLLTLTRAAGADRLTVVAHTKSPGSARKASLALENALVAVDPPALFVASGVLTATGTVSSGGLVLDLPVLALIPTLPDPYASNGPDEYLFLPEAIGNARVRMSWTAPDAPQLDVVLALDGEVNRSSDWSLLDLSGNVDQLGINLTGTHGAGLYVDELSLCAPGERLRIFTVPEISWETVFAPAEPKPIHSAGDGGRTELYMSTVALSPIAPEPLLLAYVDHVNRDNEPLQAKFALPFGLFAKLETKEPKVHGIDLRLNRPEFVGSRGGIQLSLRPRAPDETFMGVGPAELVSPYGEEILGTEVVPFVQSGFAEHIPIKRYDLSGYGASLFSEWKLDDPNTIGVIKAHFEVLVGRARYEVIQVQSYLYPWAVRVVRTITLDRQVAGWVKKFDSGWQAASEGEFHFPEPNSFSEARVHKGAVTGVYDVRNIRDLDIAVVGPIAYRRVLFDANVGIDPELEVLAGGFTAGGRKLVPSKDLVGFIQKTSKARTDLPDLGALLDQEGPCSGPLPCVIQLGPTGAKVNVVSVDVSAGGTPTDYAIVAALRGSPTLSREGSWSLGRRVKPEVAPQPLEARFGFPLVRNRSDAISPDVWHFADPKDILQLDNPGIEYGVLQSSGTQKMFFERPRLRPNVPSLDIPQAPHLADVNSLLNATGIFPSLGEALQLPGPEQLNLAGEEVEFERTWDITVPPKTLIDLKAVKVLVSYKDEKGRATQAHVRFSPNQDPKWSISLERFSFDIMITALDAAQPIMQLFVSAKVDSGTAPKVDNLNVVYGGVLDPIQTVFSRLQYLATFLPGGRGAGLEVKFSDGRLSILNAFAIPDLPLGVGRITDVALVLGLHVKLSPIELEFTAGIGSEKKPFRWLVSPLAGTGVIEVGARNGEFTLLIQGGLGVGLGIDVAVASGAATVCLAFQVDNKTAAPILFKGILTGQATVEVLRGLATVSLTLSAGFGLAPKITPPPLPAFELKLPQKLTLPSQTVTVHASVAVAIHITVCWVADVDWDGYWQFNQTLTSPEVSVSL